MGVTIKDIQFYEEKLGNKIMVHLVTSKLMELYVFFGIIAYLMALYFGLQVSLRSVWFMFLEIVVEDAGKRRRRGEEQGGMKNV